MTSISAGHIILTPTRPVGSGRPQRGSNPGPPDQESRALSTELPRPPSYTSDKKPRTGTYTSDKKPRTRTYTSDKKPRTRTYISDKKPRTRTYTSDKKPRTSAPMSEPHIIIMLA